MNIKKPLNTAILAALLGTQGAAQGAPLAISDTPLSVSTAVEPNVMLLIDTSGSMNNIIWAAGYDNTTTYDDWSDGGNNFSATSGNNHLHNIDVSHNGSSDCGSNGRWVRGDRGGVTKYLCLPDPEGNHETRFSGNYLNYLFSTYANDQDLTDGTIPNDYRMNVARVVSSDLVDSTSGMRFGAASFYGPSSQNYGHGATIDATCGSTKTAIKNAIGNYTASTNTPLAEAFYEVTRYFRGLDSYYHNNTSYTSPLQYRCQKNFVMAVTDGLPTRDTNFPSNDPDDVADTSAALPNWDNLAPNTTQAMYPNFPQYSDGFQPSGSEGNEGYALYLDDMAKFAFDVDMKNSGNDQAGGSWEDPAFPVQNIETYTVGFSTSNQMLQDAADYGNGQYFVANNADELSAALQSALNDIVSKTASSASIAMNTSFISTGARIYQGRFNSSDWTGQLLAFDIDTDPTSSTFGQIVTSGSGPDGSQWDAGDLIPSPASRKIVSWNGSTGIPFQWTNLAAAQKSAMNDDQDVLDYVRGDTSLEQANGGSFRNRASLLGDIVNSAPVFVGAPNFRYPDNWGTGEPENAAAYSTFKTAKKNRTELLWVGANDGILHAFDATSGVEHFAYIPNEVIPNLKDLTDIGYTHEFFVDGTPTMTDAFFGGAWHTVLVGGLNKGGQAIYALDITNPAALTEGNASSVVLWEFSDADDLDADGDGSNEAAGTGGMQHALGYTFSQPVIGRMHNDKWVAIFGNGYNNTEADGAVSATGTAVLYILDVQTGSVIRKIDTKAGSSATPNGLASVAPVDLNGDHVVDVIYAGDLLGNMWKFDVGDSNPNQWKVAFGSAANPAPLFTACSGTCNGSNGQPITTRPEVGRHPSGRGVLVYFGTGKYLEATDKDTTGAQTQTFYSIWDNDATVSGRSALQKQEILFEGTETFADENGNTSTFDVRVTSDNKTDYTSKKGWYLDLLPPGTTTSVGEMQVTNSLLRAGRIIFTTLIPTTDVCNAGGESWLMELDARSGSRLSFSPFDLNQNGTFETADYATVSINGNNVTVPTSGKKLPVGSAATPGVMAAGDQEFKYTSGTGLSGNYDVDVTTENPGPVAVGRQSWRQLR